MSSSNNDEVEIPGYYRCPKTKRYYRIPEGGSHTYNSTSNDIVKEYKPRGAAFKHVPDFLSLREKGIASNATSDLSLLRLKLNNIQPNDESFRLKRIKGSNSDIIFIKGGVYTLYAVYEESSKEFIWGKPFIVELKHHLTAPEFKDVTNAQNLYFLPTPYRISLSDLCEGFTRPMCLLYAGNLLNTNTGVVRLVWRPQPIGGSTFYQHYTVAGPIWCCNSNNFTETFALGVKNAVSIYNADGHMFTKSIRGNVHSVQFDKMGSIVYTGMNNGKLIVTDLRTVESVANIRIDSTGIDESLLLSDQNNIICGGFSGMLCKLDLRMRRKVTEYLGHVHTPRKVPFSVSEPHSLLCATGSDSVTRLWSLNGGTPIKEFYPIVEDNYTVPSRSWLVSNSHKCSVYLIQTTNLMCYNIF